MFNHEGSKLPYSYEYYYSTGNNNEELFIEIRTVGDLLNLLGNYDIIEIYTDKWDKLNQEVLDYGDEKEIERLNDINERLYDSYKRNKKGIISRLKKEIDKDKLIKQYYGHGGIYYFLKKDINYLKNLEQKEYTVSASFGNKTYGYKIKVDNLELYDKTKKEVIKYNGDIKIFSDNNELGFSPLTLLN